MRSLIISGIVLAVACLPLCATPPVVVTQPITPVAVPVAVPLYGVGAPSKASADLSEILAELQALREEIKALKASLSNPIPANAEAVKAEKAPRFGLGFYTARCASCHAADSDHPLFAEDDSPIPAKYRRALARLNAGTMPPKKDAEGHPLTAIPANEKKAIAAFLSALPTPPETKEDEK